MSIYYCKTTGDDARDGLSEANAWLTITKCVQTLVAGDKVYIAPGTYRNISGWSLTNAGSLGNIIEYIGDPDCEQFDDEKPGYVRLTGCNADELPSCADKIFYYNSKNYVTLKNLIVDGAESGTTYGIYMDSGTERVAENCITVGGYSGFYHGNETECIAIGGDRAFVDGTQNRCLAFGGYWGFYLGTQINCVAIIGREGFRGGTNINCLVLGGLDAFYLGTQNNCIAIACNDGFYLGTQNNCIALGALLGFHDGVLTACKAIYCKTASSGTTGEAVTASKHIGFTNLRMLKNLARWLKPDLFFEKDAGDDSVIPGVMEDILGQPRRMHDGTIDVGIFEYSDVEIDWTNYKATAPGIKINRKGVQEFDLPARKDKQIKVRVWVKFDVTGGSKPQLILKGEGISTQTDTATGDGSSFEQLEVDETPTKDTVLTVRLYQQDITVAKYAIFSDLGVS